jgi:hypothetical protein
VITYPSFVAELDGRDLDELARRSGVGVDEIEAIAEGRPASLGVQMRLSLALGKLNPHELFAVDEATEAVLADVEAQGHPRWVIDRAALRAVDEATR